MLKAWVAVAVAWCGCALAQPASFLTGNSLHGHPEDYKAGRGQYALAYITGVHDALNGERSKAGWCFATPKGGRPAHHGNRWPHIRVLD
jgi:hypothetical protein